VRRSGKPAAAFLLCSLFNFAGQMPRSQVSAPPPPPPNTWNTGDVRTHRSCQVVVELLCNCKFLWGDVELVEDDVPLFLSSLVPHSRSWICPSVPSPCRITILYLNYVGAGRLLSGRKFESSMQVDSLCGLLCPPRMFVDSRHVDRV
jgi:hypothetical protein